MAVPALFIGAAVVGVMWVASKKPDAKVTHAPVQGGSASDTSQVNGGGITVPGSETAVTDPNTMQTTYVSDQAGSTDGSQQTIPASDTGALVPADNSSGAPSGTTESPTNQPSTGIAGATQVGGQTQLPNPYNSPTQQTSSSPSVVHATPDSSFTQQYGTYNKTYAGAYYANHPNIVV